MPDHAVIAVNERSTEGATEQSDSEILLTFLRTLQEVRAMIAGPHRQAARFACPLEMRQDWRLPGRSQFRETLQRLPREQRDLINSVKHLLYAGHDFDESGFLPDVDDEARAASEPFLLGGRPARGLRVARDNKGASISFDIASWRQARIPDHATGVPNAWSPDPECYRGIKDVLGAKIWVLPEYENLGHHDPTSSACDPRKSKIPERHERLHQAALPEDRTSASTTWWAYCECRFFHRFQGTLRDGRPLVHWNGTTNPEARQNRDGLRDPTREDQVPEELREALRSHWVVSGCGCREKSR